MFISLVCMTLHCPVLISLALELQDILLRDQATKSGLSTKSGFSKSHQEIVQTHISYTLRYSLRVRCIYCFAWRLLVHMYSELFIYINLIFLQAYASILYLRKFSNFQIILRGKPVQQIKIVDELKFSKTVTYKPQTGVGSEDVSLFSVYQVFICYQEQ